MASRRGRGTGLDPGWLPHHVRVEPPVSGAKCDPALLDRAIEVSGERTKKAVVTKALQEFIARREQRRVVGLMGKLEWDDSFDNKAERSRK